MLFIFIGEFPYFSFTCLYSFLTRLLPTKMSFCLKPLCHHTCLSLYSFVSDYRFHIEVISHGLIWVFVFFTCFAYYDNVQIHLCCCERHYFILFMAEWYSMVCVYVWCVCGVGGCGSGCVGVYILTTSLSIHLSMNIQVAPMSQMFQTGSNIRDFLVQIKISWQFWTLSNVLQQIIYISRILLYFPCMFGLQHLA